MRHHAQDVSRRIRNACNIIDRSVRTRVLHDVTVRRAVAKHDAFGGDQCGERIGIGVVVAFRMGDRELQDLTWGTTSGERRGVVFDAYMNIPAHERQ